jgi:hypothetical protein
MGKNFTLPYSISSNFTNKRVDALNFTTDFIALVPQFTKYGCPISNIAAAFSHSFHQVAAHYNSILAMSQIIGRYTWKASRRDKFRTTIQLQYSGTIWLTDPQTVTEPCMANGTPNYNR